MAPDAGGGPGENRPDTTSTLSKNTSAAAKRALGGPRTRESSRFSGERVLQRGRFGPLGLDEFASPEEEAACPGSDARWRELRDRVERVRALDEGVAA